MVNALAKIKELLNKSSLVKVSAIYIVATVLVKGINFISTPIFTRIMSTSDFGIVSNFTVWGQVIATFICLQVTGGLIPAQYSVAKNRFDNYMASVIRCVVFFELFFSLVLIAGRPIWCRIFSLNEQYIFALCIYANGICLADLYTNYCVAKNKPKPKVGYSVFCAVLNITCGILCVLLMKNGSEGRILGYSITYGILAVISIIFFWRKPKSDRDLVKKDVSFALKFGIPLIPHLIANLINGNIDRVIIIKILNESQAGIYSVAYSIGVIAFVIADACNDAWVPWFAKKVDENRFKDISKAAVVYSTTVAMCFFGIMMLAPEFMKFMASKEYWSGVTCVRYVALGVFFMFMYRFAVNYEQLKGKTVYVAPATIVAALSNVGLNYYLIPKMGIDGAALATAGSYLVLWLIHEFVARRIVGNFNLVMKSYIPACIIAMVGFILSNLMIDNLILRIVTISVFVLAYMIFVLKFFREMGK